MNIVQVTPYYPPYLGGMQKVVKEISERLSKKGNNVEVFTSNIGYNQNNPKANRNLKINYLKGYEFAHTAWIPSLFFKLMKIPKNSIMHVHIAQAIVPEIVWLVSKLRNIPYICHVHTDVQSSGKLGFILPIYKKLFLRKVLKDAQRIIVLTEQYSQLIKDKFSIDKNIKVIPNGVDESFYKIVKSTDSSKINLIFVGRLTVEKNVDKIVKAFSLIKTNSQLTIVGDGEKFSSIEKLIKEKRIKNVFLIGRKEGKALLNLYSKADILILASSYEGLPLVLLEAMASKTPIVASDVIGINNLVKDVALLVNPPTIENFAKAINQLIENKKFRNDLAKKGRKRAEEYHWNRIISEFEETYLDVLNQHATKNKSS